VNDFLIRYIIVDLFVICADGRKELVEIKSPATITPLFKWKLKHLEATWLRDHPEISYRIA
jgi:hypothetical protein